MHLEIYLQKCKVVGFGCFKILLNEVEFLLATELLLLSVVPALVCFFYLLSFSVYLL